jgi:Holliday junction DNA helicase RuvA
LIASLEGILQEVGENELVLAVGGVGFQVHAPLDVLEGLPSVGETTFLYTALVVREEQPMLYGFSSVSQRSLFETLLQVSGVGPRLALAMLSHLSPENIRMAVVNNQPELLATVPGIGPKTGEKIIFHLKDRLDVPEVMMARTSAEDKEVVDVLQALGYSGLEAAAAVRSIPEEAPEEVEARVRLALKYFNRT